MTKRVLWQKLTHGSKLRASFVMISALLVLCGLGFGGRQLLVHHQQTQAKSAAMSAARDFTAALNRGDMHQAYELTNDVIHQNATEADFSETLNDLKAAAPKRTQETITLTNDGATYRVVIDGLGNTRSGRKQGIFILNMIHSKSGWRVAGINVH